MRSLTSTSLRYTLGAFSGVASSCCAPVLAGVVALSGVASSFGVALGLGAAYVFGMVAPLFLISLFWERFDWRASRLFRPRSFTDRLGPVRRTVTGTALASGVLLALMGGATLWIGLASDAMPSPSGWQSDLSNRLEHYGSVASKALDGVPGWGGVLVVAAVVLLLARHAIQQVVDGGNIPTDTEGPESSQVVGDRHDQTTLEREYVS